MAKTLDFMNTNLPRWTPDKGLQQGTGGGAKIQVRFLGSGSDASGTLRKRLSG